MLKGGRYHNLSDLKDLPIPDRADLRERPLPPIVHPSLAGGDTFAAMRSGDVLLHFPYHDFDAVVQLIKRAATDPKVRRIAITLYRVAKRSLICQALVEAALAGKRVEVLMEVQARFDEDNNLFWGEALEKAGARLVYGMEGYKVHGKLCLIERQEGRRLARYAYLGTGNFNETTARLYADIALLTANKAMTGEVAAVLDDLMAAKLPGPTKLLRMAPHALRGELERAIDHEIAQALLGKPASILLKFNSLEDKPLIRKLYDADRAGVMVRLIVRGICCLVTEVPGHSPGIKAISIVDRFLEHARAYVFHNNGAPTVHLASADWMERNLDRRVEAAFPVLDKKLKAEVLRFLELEWRDTMKARVIDRGQTNPYRKRPVGKRAVRSQTAWHAWLKRAAKRAAVRPVPSRTR
jgi:polyphosphate kinase